MSRFFRLLSVFGVLLVLQIAAPLAMTRDRAPDMVAMPQRVAAQGEGFFGLLPFFNTEPPTSLYGNYLAGYIALQDNDFQNASSFFRKALKQENLSEDEELGILNKVLLLDLISGNFKESYQVARKIISRDHYDFLARLVLGMRAFQAGSFAAAKHHFGRIQGDGLPYLMREFLLSWVYAGLGQTEKAKNIYTLLDAEFHKNSWKKYLIDMHRGILFSFLGDDTRASDFLAQAYAMDKSNLPLLKMLAQTLDASSQKKALAALYKGLPPSLRKDAFTSSLLKGAPPADQAKTKTKPQTPVISSVNQGPAQVFYSVGSIFMRENDVRIAAVLFQMSRKLDPDNPFPVLSFAGALEAFGFHDELITLLEETSFSSEFQPMVDLKNALSHNALGHFAQAQKNLEQMIEKKTEFPDAFLALGDLYRYNEQYSEAIKIYDRFLTQFPPAQDAGEDDLYWRFYYAKGIAHERLSRFAEAEQSFLQAMKYAPGQPVILNYLGYMWIQQNTHLERAFDMLHKAVTLSSGEPMILDSLGWAYYKLGRYEDAVRILEKAALLLPDDAVVNDHLGDAYWRVGRYREALFQWRHAYAQAETREQSLPTGNTEILDKAVLEKKLTNGLLQEVETPLLENSAGHIPPPLPLQKSD